jgi:hypothetical protein
VGFVRVLSRTLKRLTIRLSTLYLDDSEVVGFLVRDGKVNRWLLPGKRRDFHWDRARKKFKLVGDDVYNDDDAELFAEDGMLEEVLDHWEPQRRSTSRTRPRNWWSRPVARDFMEQRQLDFIEAEEMIRQYQKELAARSKESARKKRRETLVERRRAQPLDERQQPVEHHRSNSSRRCPSSTRRNGSF